MKKGKTNSPLGQLIKTERLKKGMSQRELAEKAKLAQSIVSKLESGQQKCVRDEAIEKIADALNLGVNELRIVTHKGPDLATDIWDEKDRDEKDYMIYRICLELTNFVPEDLSQVWIVMGHLLNTDWRIRGAAISSLSRAAENAISVDIIHKALSFVAEHDTSEYVKFVANKALKQLLKPY